MQTYLGMTAHYLNESWELKKVSLQCNLLRTAHSTAEDMLENFLGALKEYDIQLQNVTAVVTDTEPTMNKFGRLLKQRNVSWIGCVCHLLEISSAKVMERKQGNTDLEEVLKAARKLVGHFKHSSQRSKALFDAQEKGKELKLLQDVSTRWWSVYAMIDRLLQLKPYLDILVLGKKIEPHLSYQQWALLTDVLFLLEPFMKAEKFLEAEKHVTISLVTGIVYSIRKHLLHQKEEKPELGPIVEEFIEQFNKEWGSGQEGTVVDEHKKEGHERRQIGFQPVHFITSALDPRTKRLIAVPASERDSVWKMTKAAIQDCVKRTSASSTSSTSNAHTKPSEKESPPTHSNRNFMEIFSELEEDEPSYEENVGLNMNNQIEMEWIRFQSMPVLKLDQNPLIWWEQHAPVLPLISNCARKYLSIPASSAPVERLFSMAGLTVTKKRASLKPSLVNDLVFLNESWDSIKDLEENAHKKPKLR